LHEWDPGQRTQEQLKASVDSATQVLAGLYFGVCQGLACRSCKADRHCGAGRVACWCPACDPELNDDESEWAAS